jgi:RNA polymerase sigma factor (sigma-70 family)
MTLGQGPLILRHIRRLSGEAAPTDRDLLRGYLERRDETAFAALVRRHGPMVLGVCRSVLRHAQDAEDAFQAAFLVLARKAHAIRRPDGLASWLHGVAYRVALRAQAAGVRRRALEAKAAPAPAPSPDDLSWGEVRALVHAELAALPERFRAPLVLCYVQGLTQDEAARRLGWTYGTVKARLLRGRDLLRRRLERRGLGLAAALGSVALAGEALARPVAPELAAAVVRLALLCPGAAAEGAAAALARGVLGWSAAARVGSLAAVVLVTVALAAVFVVFPRPSGGGAPAAGAPPAPRAPAARTDRHGDPLPEGAVARLGTVRFNHGDMLNALYFAPDGKTIISQGSGSVRLWDAATGKELRTFSTPADLFDDQTALSPDGKTLFLLDQRFSGDTLRVWDLVKGEEARVVQLPGQRNEISVSRSNALAPDGRLCALHTPEGVRVYDLKGLGDLYALPHKGDAIRAVVFAGCDRIVTASKKRDIAVWEARTGKLIRQFAHGGPVEVLAASADGRRLATLEHHTYAIDRLLDRDVVHIWDLTTGTRVHTLAARPKRWYMGARFSPDGKLLFTASTGFWVSELTVWDAETGKRLRELRGTLPSAVSPDGSRLAVRVGLGRFVLYDPKTGRCLDDEDSPHAAASAVWLSPDGGRALTLGRGSLATWGVAAGRRLHSFAVPPHVSSHSPPSYSPDGRYAVTLEASDWERARPLVWDVAARRRLHTLDAPNTTGNTTSAFSPDSSVLATWHPGKETVVRLWDVRTGKERRSFKDTGAGWPGRLAFTADGKTLFVCGRRTVGLDVATGKEHFSWRLQPQPSNVRDAAVGGKGADDNDRVAWRALAVSPDGSLVACILDRDGLPREPAKDRIVLCDGRTGKVIHRWSDSGIRSRWGERLDFSRDGRLLASSDGSAVHVWEVATGQTVRTLRGHRSEIEALAFSAGGRRLASASSDGTTLVWEVPLASRPGGPPAGDAGDKEVAAWWADLLNADPGRAYTAVWRLAETSARSVPLLRQRIKPVPDSEAKEIRRCVKDLGSPTFAVRQKAFERLKDLGLAAAPAVRTALEKDNPLEVRRRLEQLLEGATRGPVLGGWLRTLRALAVLEYAGTPEARRLLRELAGGAQGAWLTREAKAACDRLDGGAATR